jgi:hypothetical protein
MFVYYEIKRDCKRTKYNPSLDKIQEYRRNWLQHTNRIPLITENIKKTTTNRWKKPGETIQETLGYV